MEPQIFGIVADVRLVRGSSEVVEGVGSLGFRLVFRLPKGDFIPFDIGGIFRWVEAYDTGSVGMVMFP